MNRNLFLAIAALFIVIGFQVGVASGAFLRRRPRPVAHPQTVTLEVRWGRAWTKADRLCIGYGASVGCFDVPEGKTEGVALVSVAKPSGPVGLTKVLDWEPGRITDLTMREYR